MSQAVHAAPAGRGVSLDHQKDARKFEGGLAAMADVTYRRDEHRFFRSYTVTANDALNGKAYVQLDLPRGYVVTGGGYGGSAFAAPGTRLLKCADGMTGPLRHAWFLDVVVGSDAIDHTIEVIAYGRPEKHEFAWKVVPGRSGAFALGDPFPDNEKVLTVRLYQNAGRGVLLARFTDVPSDPEAPGTPANEDYDLGRLGDARPVIDRVWPKSQPGNYDTFCMFLTNTDGSHNFQRGTLTVQPLP